MKILYIAIGSILLLFLFILNAFASGASNTNISIAINSTGSFLNTVNKSTYLFFSPNLSQAYGYLDNAINVSKTDPNAAYPLLNSAMQSAQEQENKIDSYRNDSFIVMLVLFVVCIGILYIMMKPQRKIRRQKI